MQSAPTVLMDKFVAVAFGLQQGNSSIPSGMGSALAVVGAGRLSGVITWRVW